MPNIGRSLRLSASDDINDAFAGDNTTLLSSSRFAKIYGSENAYYVLHF